MKKLANTAKKLDTAAKIIFWLLAVGGGVIVAVSLLIVFAGEHLLSGTTASLILGDFSFDLSEEYTPAVSMIRLEFASGAAAVAAAAAVTCLGIHFIRKILAPMKDERPFDGSVHRNIRKLAWLTLIGGIVISILTAVQTSITFAAYDFEKIFINDAITGVNADITLDCSFIIVFFLLYLLSIVFKYGEELQIQSDETL